MTDETAATLHFPATDDLDASVFVRVGAKQAGWQNINMVALQLRPGDPAFALSIEDYEYVAVILGGVCDIRTNRGEFLDVGRRPDVFTGMPYAIYLPRQTDFEVEALTEDFAMASFWAPAITDRPAKLIRPTDVDVQIEGGGNATTQVNTILRPGDASQQLTVWETYTPGGNWGQYPPHKHDTPPADDALATAEVALEELIFYKFDRPGGYALQRIYTEDRSLDQTLTAQHNDVVVVPRGYHPLTTTPGYTAYTLHVTAGAAQPHDRALRVDPRFRWVREQLHTVDPRLPIVDHGMEPLFSSVETIEVDVTEQD